MRYLTEDPYGLSCPGLVYENLPSHVPPTPGARYGRLETFRKSTLASTNETKQLDRASEILELDGIGRRQQKLIDQTETTALSAVWENVFKISGDGVNLVSKLADQGHPRALYKEGTFFQEGLFGFRKDSKKAYRRYVRAANGGHSSATD